MKNIPFSLCIFVGSPAFLFSTIVGHAAEKHSNAANALSTIDTESVISDISSLDRTRPFPVGEKVAYFVNIKNGDRVKSPFRVAFAISGMGISPVKAGKLEGTGHHHILINMPLPVDIKQPIPFDKPNEYQNQRYKHFGKGETETILDLPPGKHKLRLLFADHDHIPYYIGSKEVEIHVLARNVSAKAVTQSQQEPSK